MNLDEARIADALLSSESDAILAADPAGNIRFWNPGAERIFGHSADAVVGRSMDLVIPEKLRAPHWEAGSGPSRPDAAATGQANSSRSRRSRATDGGSPSSSPSP